MTHKPANQNLISAQSQSGPGPDGSGPRSIKIQPVLNSNLALVKNKSRSGSYETWRALNRNLALAQSKSESRSVETRFAFARNLAFAQSTSLLARSKCGPRPIAIWPSLKRNVAVARWTSGPR